MKRLQYGQFSVAVFLATTLATLPMSASTAPEGSSVQVKTLYIHVNEPLPGQPIQLPDTVPVEVRPQALALLEHTPPGQAVVVAPPEVQTQYASLVQNAVSKAGVTLAPATSTGPTDGSNSRVWGCLGWVLVIIIVVVVAVIIYVLWKLCQAIPPAQTNSPPTDPYPVVVRHQGSLPDTQPLTLLSDSPSLYCDVQVNTDLRTPNWWTLATLTANQAVNYTNYGTNLIWSVVAARDTNGNLLASSIVTGPSTNFVIGERPLNIPYPGTPPDKLFIRLLAR